MRYERVGLEVFHTAAISAPQAVGNSQVDLVQPFFIHTNHSDFRDPCVQTFDDISDFMIDGGGERYFTRIL